VVANGGSVSASTMRAVSKFCADIDAAGIRDRFYRLNLFAGTGLNACLVPLYRGQSRTGTQYGNTTDTNTNFVSGDYVETGASGGLAGNASNKRLNTGLAGSTAEFDNIHLSAYEISASTNVFRVSIGMRTNFGAPGFLLLVPGSTSNYQWSVPASGIEVTQNPPTGHWIGVQTANRTGNLYRNGSSVSTTYFGGANSNTSFSTLAHDLAVFCVNDGGSPNVHRDFSNTRLGGYSVGPSITGTQAASFYTAMQALQTSLTRNV
jgi:hypothetical protein